MTPVTRILTAYAACTAEERARGMVEYRRYLSVVVATARRHKVRHDVAAGVLAILSPGLTWAQNQESADCVFRGERGWGYSQNVRKAERLVMAQRRPTATGVIVPTYIDPRTSPKVIAFYRLIRDGGNPHDICVDGHAFNLAFGAGRRTLKRSTEKIGNKRKYDLVRQSYCIAARIIGIWPCQLQAATWIAWRSSGGFVQGRIDFPIGD